MSAEPLTDLSLEERNANCSSNIQQVLERNGFGNVTVIAPENGEEDASPASLRAPFVVGTAAPVVTDPGERPSPACSSPENIARSTRSHCSYTHTDALKIVFAVGYGVGANASIAGAVSEELTNNVVATLTHGIRAVKEEAPELPLNITVVAVPELEDTADSSVATKAQHFDRLVRFLEKHAVIDRAKPDLVLLNTRSSGHGSGKALYFGSKSEASFDLLVSAPQQSGHRGRRSTDVDSAQLLAIVLASLRDHETGELSADVAHFEPRDRTQELVHGAWKNCFTCQ